MLRWRQAARIAGSCALPLVVGTAVAMSDETSASQGGGVRQSSPHLAAVFAPLREPQREQDVWRPASRTLDLERLRYLREPVAESARRIMCSANGSCYFVVLARFGLRPSPQDDRSQALPMTVLRLSGDRSEVAAGPSGDAVALLTNQLVIRRRSGLSIEYFGLVPDAVARIELTQGQRRRRVEVERNAWFVRARRGRSRPVLTWLDQDGRVLGTFRL
jgi:hypothetical protein